MYVHDFGQRIPIQNSKDEDTKRKVHIEKKIFIA